MGAKHASTVERLLLSPEFDGEFFKDEPMSKHTTYRIGGPARYFVRVDSLGALARLVEACEDARIPSVVVGRGSNLLVSDEGVDGVIIVLGRDFKNMQADEDTCVITAGSAVLLSSVVQEALRCSFGGLEFCVGTPGSLGGALFMNAGSRDEWIGSKVRSITVHAPETGITKLSGNDVEWGYRHTSFREHETILECELALVETDPFFIRAKLDAGIAKRKKSQPLTLPSCGSVFKNPDGASAAKMIDECGLKGLTIGGAQISEVHANFIVNLGEARASDVLELMHIAQAKVKEVYGYELKPEVRFLGFEKE